MKKILLFTIAITLSLVTLTCEKDQDPLVEDNNVLKFHEKKSKKETELEKWVSVNYKTLSTYNREEISTYSRNVQKAILRSFSPEKRKNIWQSKVDYLLTNSSFSKNEIEYLNWYAEQFKNLSYERAFDQDLAQEMYDRAINGIDIFKWSKGQIHNMFFTIGNLKNDKVKLQQRARLIQAPDDDSNGTWCECYYDLGCPNWNCDSDADCDDGGENPHDCGIFGGTDCDGNC